MRRDALNRYLAIDDKRIAFEEEQLKTTNKADGALVEFKFYFSGIQENLKKFLAVMDKIEDADKKAKFKGAAVQFLEMTLEELKL